MPTPPEAMTGTVTASATARVSSRSKAGLGAVAVHRGEQDLAGAELGDVAGELRRRRCRRIAPAVREDLPAQLFARLRHALGVDGDDDALSAELLGRLLDELPVLHGGGVDRHLVGAGVEQPRDVLDGAHAAADGQRHEAALGGALDDVEDVVAVLVARRDVEEAQLVGAGGVVGCCGLDRIAGVDEVDEVARP